MVSTVDHDGRFKDVEESTAWTMRFPSGVLASCTTSYGAQMPGYYKIFGLNGWMEGTFGYDGVVLRASYSPGNGQPQVRIDETNPERDPYQFVLQADHFTECILENKTPRTPGEEGLRDMQYIDAIYRAAGVRA
jgi:predicted dehydrogenase